MSLRPEDFKLRTLLKDIIDNFTSIWDLTNFRTEAIHASTEAITKELKAACGSICEYSLGVERFVNPRNRSLEARSKFHRMGWRISGGNFNFSALFCGGYKICFHLYKWYGSAASFSHQRSLHRCGNARPTSDSWHSCGRIGSPNISHYYCLCITQETAKIDDRQRIRLSNTL